MSTAVLPRAELHDRLRAFKERYAEEYGLLALGYFGSYARGEAREDSDIDIVFDTDYPNLFRTVMLKQDLEAWLGKRIDILRLVGINKPRMRARVERDAVYV